MMIAWLQTLGKETLVRYSTSILNLIRVYSKCVVFMRFSQGLYRIKHVEELAC